jgi:hypothetical protein
MLRDALRPRGRVVVAERGSRQRESGRRPSHRPDVCRSKLSEGVACGLAHSRPRQSRSGTTDE